MEKKESFNRRNYSISFKIIGPLVLCCVILLQVGIELEHRFYLKTTARIRNIRERLWVISEEYQAFLKSNNRPISNLQELANQSQLGDSAFRDPFSSENDYFRLMIKDELVFCYSVGPDGDDDQMSKLLIFTHKFWEVNGDIAITELGARNHGMPLPIAVLKKDFETTLTAMSEKTLF